VIFSLHFKYSFFRIIHMKLSIYIKYHTKYSRLTACHDFEASFRATYWKNIYPHTKENVDTEPRKYDKFWCTAKQESEIPLQIRKCLYIYEIISDLPRNNFSTYMYVNAKNPVTHFFFSSKYYKCCNLSLFGRS